MPSRLADNDRFLRLPEVEHMTGLRKSTIYDMIGRKQFPAQYVIGPKVVIWLESEVRAWMSARLGITDPPGAA